MSERSPLSVLAEELALAFIPLSKVLSSPDYFRPFMLDLGWDLTQIPDPLKNLKGALDSVINIIESGEIDDSIAINLISATSSLITAIKDLKSQPDDLFPSSVDAGEFKSKLPEQLIDVLLVDYFLNYHLNWGKLLQSLDIIKLEEIEPSGLRPAYIKKEISWREIPVLLKDPISSLKKTYDWGGPDFKAEELLRIISSMADSWGLENYLDRPDKQMIKTLIPLPADLKEAQNWELYLPLINEGHSDNHFALGLGLFMVPKMANDEPGISILPYGDEKYRDEVELFDDIVLRAEGGLDLPGGLGILVTPKKGLQVVTGLISGSSSSVSGSMAIIIENKASGVSKIILIGSKGGSRLQIGALSLGLGVNVDPKGKGDIYAEFKSKDASIVINPSAGDADSFLSTLLPKDGLSLDFSLLLGFSSSRGFYLGGSSGLEISIPAYKSIGPVEINGITLAIKFSEGIIPLDIGTTIKAEIGPIQVLVENFGLSTIFSFPEGSSGNLGPLDMRFAFKPPRGIGVTIDAGPVTGGGFISYDLEKCRYSGALQLKIYEISISAIGILDTRLPGGTEGYSFIIIIFGEFAPIQLGLGFTLNGVGGLAGIHRTVMVEVLQEGIRRNLLDSILFPKDPVANATTIINNISTVFPPATGNYVFGPMAIIGWGTPSIVEARLGIILELPEPIRLLILGQINAALPSDDAALIELHIDVVGVIDFTNKRLAIDSSLHDSGIIGCSISGDASLRLDWGDNPNFALAIGGFNPHFQPPPGFPALRRITLALGWGPSQLNIQFYFAITSNTLQFGGQVDLYVDEGFFNIKGWLGLDALIVYSPFHFIVDFRAGVALRVWRFNLLGISLDGHIAGPSPWHIWGEACISILFWDICVDFDLSTGEDRPNTVLPEDVWERLRKAIQDERNWLAEPAPDAFKVVSLAPVAAGGPTVIVDPVGSVSFHQKVLPLNRKITKFGEAKPEGPDKFNLDRVRVGPNGEEKSVTPQILQDFFAPGQFEEMSDADKLSRPSFVKMDAGVLLQDNLALAGNKITEMDLTYETHLILEKGSMIKDEKPAYLLSQEKQLSMILKGAAARSALRTTGLEKFANRRRDKVMFDEEEYVVASIEDLSVKIKGKRPMTKDAAYLALNDYLGDHPEEKGTLQVISLAEA